MLEYLQSWKAAAPAAGAIIALVSAIVALFVFHYTRRSNRRRATLDLVMKTLLDESAQKRYSAFKRLIRKDGDPNDCFKLESLAEVQDENAGDRDLVIQQLNTYELISLGVRRGIFDEEFYKRWFHNQFRKDYESSHQLICKVQEKKSSIYCEYSALYRKWCKDGHPDASPGRLKMVWWSLTKNYTKIDEARISEKAR